MRPPREIRGLRYPDEFLVRHFFRRGLHERPGRVVELGCGAGANLGVYQEFGWSVEGADIHAPSIENARWNLGADALLVEADLSKETPAAFTGPYDALLLPSSIYYLGAPAAERLIADMAARLKPGCEIYLRVRLVDDYRYGRGETLGHHTFRLNTPETGEAGQVNQFYTEAEAVDLMRRTLDIRELVTLRVRYDAMQPMGLVPGNSDLIIWGVTPP